jgi:hypothetical protein
MKKRDILMLLGALALVGFLLLAPEETTSPVPHDDTHQEIFLMVEAEGKKATEKTCVQCHYDDGGIPFPPEHPTKSRCLFCHKIKNSTAAPLLSR